MARREPSNDDIASLLDRIAELLEAQDANPHRVRAYREGAQSVRAAEESLAEWVMEADEDQLQELPGIGTRLAALIAEYVRSGRSVLYARLRGEVSPGAVFDALPGIGEELSERIVDQLDVCTLEELEQAAHDGRLEQVEGFGPQRVEMVRIALAALLSGAAQRRLERTPAEQKKPQSRPDVALLLQVDEEYRSKAEADELKRIAPKRFNPGGKAWLPIMHAEREGWDITALYSNTARAHELYKTHDWVVMYYDRDGDKGQATVVTETSGPLEGKRVVRGREAECRRYYGI